MTQGLTTDLLIAALAVGVFGFVLIVRQLSAVIALPVSVIKAAIPLIYFAMFFDGSWTFIDDVTYQSHGEALRLDYSPLSALLQEEGRAKLIELSDGRHFLYAWWNLFAQSIFGDNYYAAVFLNVLLTFFTGAVLFRLLGDMGFSRSYQRGALVFFLLHWDVLVWSSLVNLKDVLVMALIVPTIYFLIRLRIRFGLIPLLGAVAGLFVLTWIRYYIPFFLISSFVVWILLEGRFRWKYLSAALAGVAFLVLLLDWSALEYVQPEQIVLGLMRAPLTPQPWSIEEEYSFLLLPSILHWLLFLPMVIGAIALWGRAAGARFVLVFVVLMMLFYALVPELQGPRHRVQLTFAIVWMQFHFLWLVTLLALRGDVRLRAAAR